LIGDRPRAAVAHLLRVLIADKIDDVDFIPPILWSPNSLDLNPVDYKIWGVLQERASKTSINDKLRRWIAVGQAGSAHNY